MRLTVIWTALIRPGRVDLHVRFELPSRGELRSLFLSIYCDVVRSAEIPVEQEKEKKDMGKLENLADQFAENLPERRFSIADVQGFLWCYKWQPEEACVNVEDWVKEMEIED
ncbi:hypothetical protein N7532_006257 [Penicillium argentinense]|uniref:Mitochondrial chaperone BCS1-like ATPase lid domain-containing protein n=1 Tax=Penicillium argentinense TaxID=1131581 RepID=A0A9W9KB62_9EURO|nr:uncharacterized protein N7532_006257 [Penicillium argentinense]KAJ5099256.1 hypothetical protein N7532_006257 [Penicillium argentinense]